MKKIILLFGLFAFLAFTSCEKTNTEKDKDWKKDEILEICTWDEASEASGPDFEKYTVKELVYSETCGCYTEGVEKFLENGVTRFLIYYVSKDCDGYGYKVTCENGDCEKGTKCKFLQECEGDG